MYERRHMVELELAKKEHITASGEKRVDTPQQVGDLRSRFVRRERSGCEAKKASRHHLCFTELLLKLFTTRSQQSHMDLRVLLIHMAKIPGREDHGLLVEGLGGRNSGSLGRKKS